MKKTGLCKDHIETVCFDVVSSNFGVSKEKIKQGGNARIYCNPRHAIAHILINHYNFSRNDTAALFNRDRSTIYNSLSRAKGMMVYDSVFKQRVEKAKKEISVRLGQVNPPDLGSQESR